MMSDNRPVFLNLFQFRFPIAAIMSVGHRASGIFLSLLVPALVYLLDLSTSGPEGFARTLEILDNLLVKLLLFITLWSLLHHLLAGIRFLFIDFHIGAGKVAGRQSAMAVTIAATLLAILFGFAL
ncbi:MAG: succinate dehydrogenase, cytochrome b556 subunit [Candidatus Sedimenticola endophacoides]